MAAMTNRTTPTLHAACRQTHSPRQSRSASKHPQRTVALALSAALASLVHADSMQLAAGGLGEALIYPYYTARNGTVSLLSVVNESDNVKAVRVRVREGVGGRVVGEFNLFLSQRDVWTGAFVAQGEGTILVSSDKSCTIPKPVTTTQLVLSSAGYAADGPAYQPYTASDRTREGFVELIEMATIVTTSALGRDIPHIAGVPKCQLVGEAASAAHSASLLAPTGGLMGSMSFINTTDGIGVSYAATAISRFWSTANDKPAPVITNPQTPSAANARSEPDLASGGNRMVSVQSGGAAYVSTFARSIDAVSALFMAAQFGTEYGFTSDGTFASTFVMTMPTKPYYIHSGSELGPFASAYSATDGRACDPGVFSAVTREEFIGVPDATCAGLSCPPALNFCSVVNEVRPSASQLTGFSSPRASSLDLVQNAGMPVVNPGREGGHVRMEPSAPGARLVPQKSVVVKRSTVTGEIESAPASLVFVGLPAIGYALSVAKYNVGNPQQNFGNLNPIAASRKIETRTD